MINEDARQDTEYRKKAERIYNAFKSELDTNHLDNFKYKLTNKGRDLYYINTLQLGFDSDEYVNIIITEPMKEYRDVKAAVDGNNNLVIFYDFENNIDIAQNTTLKPLFVHEMIHILDNKRSNFKIPSSADEDTTEDYYNSPSELNAHYQEGITDLETTIETFKSKPESYEKLYDMFFDDPDKFIKFALSRMDKDFISALTNDNLKKIKKRLYNYYDTYNKEYLKP